MDSAEDGGVKLDPPDALVDTPIDSAGMISTGPVASTTDPAQRSNSIGTLTSWQLLARQVGDGEVEDDNEVPARKQASAVPEDLLCSPRSASWTSGHSISPRPHHALYKEYRLLETIGKGAFGTVSIAVRRSDGKKLVAKEISQSIAALATAKQREAIMDEVNVLARMKHPNIVRYHDCFMDPNYLIILMEYCNAGDLAGLIKKQAGQLLPEKHVMFLFVQICLAMHHVHTAGVLHRDLKTSNILATRPSGAATSGSSTPTIASRRASTSAPGRGHSSSEVPASAAADFDSLPLLKLADFGVSKAGCNTEGSMLGTTVGTPHYLSPEMCDGKRYGKKTDVWALGCILYEIACLNKAFEASNIGGIYRKIAAAEYTPLPDCFSSGLKDLVRALVAKETKQRPSVAETLNMPYVRQHLAQYLDWARNVPEAQPEVLLASIAQSPDGALSPKIPASRMGSQRLPASPLSHVSSAVPVAGDTNLRVGSRSTPGDATSTGSGAQHSMAGQGMHTGSRPPALMLPQDAAGSQSSGSPAAPLCSAPSAAAVMPPQQSPPTAVLDCVQQQPAPGSVQHSALGESECRQVSMSSSGAALQATNMAGTAGQPASISSAPEAVPAKPNPFYAAAAALAEVPGLEAGPATVGSAVLPALAMLPHKKRLNVGGGSCSLDVWASANEPSSDLIAAFHNNSSVLLDCTASGGPRRVSSTASSAAHTPRSPLGQFMHSWQQDQLQEYLQPGTQPVDKGTEQDPSSYRSTEETCLPAVPMPWLAAQAADDSSRAQSADNWLATLVRSLQKLEHENADLGAAAAVTVEAAAAPASGKQPAGTASVAPQPSAMAFKDWNPSMALMSKDNPAAGADPAGQPRSHRSTGEQPPTSLQSWLGDDCSLLQILQKRATRTSRTSHSGVLPSPLGAGAVPARALSPGSSFVWPPAAGPSGFIGTKAEAFAAAAASPTAFNPHKPTGLVAPPVILQDCVVVSSNPAAAAPQAVPLPDRCCPGWQASVGNEAQQQQQPAVEQQQQQQLNVVMPYVTMLAGSGAEECDDNLPLAVMVKQCLSGNSFVHNRSGNSVTSSTRSRACSVSGQPPQAVDRSAPVSRYDSGVSQTASGSGSSNATQQPLQNGGRQDSGQLADQAAARLLTEQQEVVSRFNAFRTTLGIYPQKTMEDVINLMHLQCMQ